MEGQFDFTGLATKNDILCADGRTIRKGAFDECFIVEDKDGLFRVEDLKDFFMKKSSTVDLEATGLIQGLSLVAYKNDDDSDIEFVDSVLTRLGINTKLNREDIARRLNAVYRLGEMEEVDLGLGLNNDK